MDRSQDGHLVHANCDTDVIVDEQPTDPNDTTKPAELYHIIEQLVQGRRRLQLFGTASGSEPRRGWVTLGSHVGASTFDPEQYAAFFQVRACVCFYRLGQPRTRHDEEAEGGLDLCMRDVKKSTARCRVLPTAFLRGKKNPGFDQR